MQKKIKIEHFDRLNMTPAVSIALEGQHALIEAGLALDALNLGWDQRAVLARVKGDIAGVITWSIHDWTSDAFIHLGYVRPAYRGKGVYRALWDALVEKAREKKLLSVSGVTDIENYAMRAVAAALGRKEASVGLTFKL